MSIPLDRLYHYLEGLTSDDIIIYRWFPHGSKKLDDLLPLSLLPKDTKEEMTKVNIICHDQEPLNYNYYSDSEIQSKANKLAELKKLQFPDVKIAWWHSEEFLKMLASSHLRTAIDFFVNFNDNVLLCHSEKNSEQLKIYETNGFVGVYYWAHALIARDWFRYAEYDPLLTTSTNSITHDFLIYGRAWSGTREYRLTFAELILDNALIPHCKTKFNPWDNQIHYTDHCFVNDKLQISRSDIENFIPMNTVSSDASGDYDSNDYSSTGIEVVLETLFDDNRLHLTEKSLRPIACGKPFILVATPGSLEYLRSYGFKTFDCLIDESYDTIKDPLQRLHAVVQELKRIANLSETDKKVLWSKLYQVAEYNKNRFFSRNFHDDITKEFVENVTLGINYCKQTMNGKWIQLALGPGLVDQTVSDSYSFEWVNEWLTSNLKNNQEGNFSTVPSQLSPGSDSE